MEKQWLTPTQAFCSLDRHGQARVRKLHPSVLWFRLIWTSNGKSHPSVLWFQSTRIKKAFPKLKLTAKRKYEKLKHSEVQIDKGRGEKAKVKSPSIPQFKPTRAKGENLKSDICTQAHPKSQYVLLEEKSIAQGKGALMHSHYERQARQYDVDVEETCKGITNTGTQTGNHMTNQNWM